MEMPAVTTITRPRPSLLLLLLLLANLFVLVVSCCAETKSPAADELGSPRRRRAASVMVPITILKSAVSEGAGTETLMASDPIYILENENKDAYSPVTLQMVSLKLCMDGTPPAYHLDPGSGAGKNNWIVNLEGGAWCNNARTCRLTKGSDRGSSDHMEKEIAFTGIMSSSPVANPDFYNWNRVKIRYCDGGSFAGDTYNKEIGANFRGQRIWNATIRHLLSIGMASANQALLTGCSSGGLAVILHCDDFRAFFPPGRGTTVKCLADAGFYLDAVDVSGGLSLRSYFGDIVAMQGVARNLPPACTARLDETSCFFPQNIIDGIKTPIFLLNTAYDFIQIVLSLAPNRADPSGAWNACKSNHSACNASQMKALQDFRDQMVASVKDFSGSKKNGLFINSCFAHCQSELPGTWNNPAGGSPAIQNKGIARSVGDWYFDRAEVKAIDCPYPCGKNCHNII